MLKSAHNYLKSAHNYDPVSHSKASATRIDPDNAGEIAAVQDDSNNINVIAHNMMQTGVIPQHTLQPLTDFSLIDVEDYADGLRRIKAANHAFMGLPPEFRATFDNDPYKAVDALNRKTNAEVMEMINAAKEKARPNAPTGGATGGSVPADQPGHSLSPGATGNAAGGDTKPAG